MPAMLSLGGPEEHRAQGALLQETNEHRRRLYGAPAQGGFHPRPGTIRRWCGLFRSGPMGWPGRGFPTRGIIPGCFSY